MKSKILVSIFILAAAVRLWGLADFPSGFNADEAALGYNAYSLLTTGKDEHGHPWPINLESFGDFKPAMYSYLLIPLMAVFGLDETAVRLPSALAGIASVVFIYFLSRRLFPENRLAAVLSALVLAISPWAIHFSRGAWETNVATLCILIAVWLWVGWIQKPRFITLAGSGMFLAMSMYTYQSARVIAPLLGIGLAVVYARQLIPRFKQLLLFALCMAAILAPLAASIISSDASSRLSGVGLLADEGPLNRVKEFRGQHISLASLPGKILHNRPVIYSIQFMKNYLEHWDGDFLFVNGDKIERSKIPETGLLHFTDVFFVAIGIWALLRRKDPHSKTVWVWLLVAPVAAALTFQTPHALRAHNMVIPLSLLTALGASVFISALRTRLSAVPVKSVLIVILCLYTWQFSRLLHQYFVHYPKEYPLAWEHGFKELVEYVDSVDGQYQRILVTDKYDQPYILFLFYLKYSPANFQGNHQLTFRDKFNFSTVRDFDKYHFESTPWTKVSDIHSALIIAAPEDVPPVGVNIVRTINFPDGTPAFKIISN